MSSSPLAGPTAVPPSPTHALICLHGFGASGHDLIPLASPLQAALGKVTESGTPLNLAVYSPHGPEETPFGEGRQWFDNAHWSFKDEKGMQAAARQIDDYLTAITEAHQIPRERMVLFGFSQGGMLSLYALPYLKEPPGGLISCSGGLTVEPTINEANRTIPILLLHGLDDDVWPADHTVKAGEFYRKHGYPVHMELIHNLAHGIDARALAHITLFLGDVWHAGQPGR